MESDILEKAALILEGGALRSFFTSAILDFLSNTMLSLNMFMEYLQEHCVL